MAKGSEAEVESLLSSPSLPCSTWHKDLQRRIIEGTFVFIFKIKKGISPSITISYFPQHHVKNNVYQLSSCIFFYPSISVSVQI